MIKHIILWKLNEELSPLDKKSIKENAKKSLESLVGKIDGCLEMSININPLDSSNVDMMMDSTFSSYEALSLYKNHPEHVLVADTYVRPYTIVRSCMDFDTENN